MNDILLIDKPTGITSFDCIRILRRKLGAKKIGHAGTLDPMATGLLIIGVGEGTRKLQEFLKLPKTYEADILLGVRTDTGDIDGKIIEESGSMKYEVWKEREEDIRKILSGMAGNLQLPVPAYSAIKRGGEALYRKARRGEHVELPVKTMEVTSVEFLGMGRNIVSARFDVGSGAYIRSLAEEFGRRLGVPATLAGLRRTRIGTFNIEDAKRLEIS